MLAPRFTLRTGLIVLTLGSVGGIVIREAAFGTPWAVGLCVAACSVVFLLALHATAFALSLAVGRRVEESE